MKLVTRRAAGRTWTVAVFTGATAEAGARALAGASGGRAEQDGRAWIVRPAAMPWLNQF